MIRAAICGTDAVGVGSRPDPLPPGRRARARVRRARRRGSATTSRRLRVGDRVVSGAGISCGHCAGASRERTNLCAEYRTLGLQVDGGLAEYVTSPAAICRPVPDGVRRRRGGDDPAARRRAPRALARRASGPDDAVAVIGAGGIGSFIVAGAAHGARRTGASSRSTSTPTGSPRRARSGRRDGRTPRARTSPSCCSSSPTASASTS